MSSNETLDLINLDSARYSFYNLDVLSSYIDTIRTFNPDYIDTIYGSALHEFLYENDYSYFLQVLVEHCEIEGIEDIYDEYLVDLIAINADVITQFGRTEDDVIDDVMILLKENEKKGEET